MLYEVITMDKEMIGTKSASNLFNKQSGLLGITGVSSDMREIRSAADAGNQMAKLGLEMYSYRIKKYIGSFAAAMGRITSYNVCYTKLLRRPLG